MPPHHSSKATIRRRRIPSTRRRDGLIRYAHDNTSQNGEDGIIKRLFELIPPSSSLSSSSSFDANDKQQQQQSSRYCVDVGAWDGKHLSNTYSLLLPPTDKNSSTSTIKVPSSSSSWKGVLIEADPSCFSKLSSLHSPHGHTCLNTTVSCLPSSPHHLSSLLHRHAPNLPSNFDFLCIDVDGIDYWVFHDIISSEEYRPMVICVEFNPSITHDVIYIPPRDDNSRHGCSLAALYELSLTCGFRLVETTLYNAFFVPELIYKAYLSSEVPDTTLESLHEMSMGTALYQLYDGTLKLSGCKKMLWHRVPMKEEMMQVLPKEQRQFPFAPPPPPLEDESQYQPLLDSAIDMSSYFSTPSSPISRQSCRDSLYTQLQTDGFALLHSTSLPAPLSSAALLAARSYLHSAPEAARRRCLSDDRARRGYAPPSTENFASLVGERRSNDVVKKFRLGGEMEGDGDNNRSPLLRPNVWPRGEDWDEDSAHHFRKLMEDYYTAINQVAEQVVGAVSEAIAERHPERRQAMKVFKNEEDDQPCNNRTTSILTLLGYNTGSRHRKKTPLVAAHTDVGVVTILLFDGGDVAVLQRADTVVGDNGTSKTTWLDVELPPVKDSDDHDVVLVVNIGDCLSELSGNVLPSTLHRVMPKVKGGTERTCLALFLGLDPDAEIVLEEEGVVISYEEWRRRRIARAQKVMEGKGENGG